MLPVGSILAYYTIVPGGTKEEGVCRARDVLGGRFSRIVRSGGTGEHDSGGDGKAAHSDNIEGVPVEPLRSQVREKTSFIALQGLALLDAGRWRRGGSGRDGEG